MATRKPRSQIFADLALWCDNTVMRKVQIVALTILASGLLLVGSTHAQQTPAAPTSQTPPAKASAATAPKTPAAKTPATSTSKTAAPLVLKTEKDKASYAIGMNMGKGMQKQGVEIDPAILARGLKDALAGGKTLMTDEEAKAALTALQGSVQKKQEVAAKVQGEANKKQGEEFLAANKAKDGIITLPSGLQYKILQTGTGPKPTAADTVVCNYKGTLIDNTEFDSSYKHGQPATFPVNQVIKGWTEALQLMPVGSKWELFIPADLAYGDRGTPGGPIGPDATLIFEVELLSIQEKGK